MSSLDAQIDDLYRLPLAEFTRARNALMKTVRGADATRIRTLAKPTVAAWAVNQVYWQSRPVYDRLMKAGNRLRRAQIAALTGKAADLREASDAHRRALADAVREAERLAASAGSHPAPVALMRTLEALSLAKEPPDRPGRLADALQPAGFEALRGVTPHAKLRSEPASTSPGQPATTSRRHDDRALTEAVGRSARAEAKRAASERAEARRKAAEDKRRAAAERKRAAEVRKAEAALERARAKMLAAEEALKRMQDRS